MRRLIMVLLLLQFSLLFGAYFEVVSQLVERPTHLGLTRLEDKEKLDDNWEVGALVIINCGIPDVFFENTISKISQSDRSGAYWVVLKKRARYFLIKKEGYSNHRYAFPSPLEGGKVYEMTIDEKNKLPDETTLIITSNQNKAQVYLDGKQIGTTENKVFSGNVTLGPHQIELRKSGFQTKQVSHNITMKDNRLEINLDPAIPAAVTITTEPEGATIYIDNVYFEISSKSGFFYEGTYPLKIEKDGYGTIEENITITEPETKKHYILKDIRATLTIKTNPEASITINSAVYKGGIDKLKLNPQTINVTVEQELCETINETYILKDNENKVIELYPKDISATLTINTSENATIKLNGKSYNKVKNLKLPSSVVEIEVSHPNAETIRQIVTLKHGDNQVLDIYPEIEVGTIIVVTIPTSASIRLIGDTGEYYTAIGRKSFSDIPIGTYELVVNNDGYKSHKETIRLTIDNTVQKQISLEEGSDIPDTFVFVQGGTFQMGSNDGDDDEKPVHSVTVSDFYIGKYEVTQAEWQEVMGNNPSFFKGDNNPVEQVTWYDVVDFCNKKSRKDGLEEVYSGSAKNIKCDFSKNGYRLPTEAEWEYAASGGNKSQGYKYSGSNKINQIAVYKGNNNKSTKAVGGKKANELGIYDMSGNVWEWCWDWYGGYSSRSQTDPVGPTSGYRRVGRGGSWNGSATRCRVAYRSYRNPTAGYCYIGFRLARSSR